MNTQQKIIIAYYAVTQMQIELIDELKGTTHYKQRIKSLSNQIQVENERIINDLYTRLNDDTEAYFNQTVGMIETMIDVIKTKDLNVFIALLSEYKDGNVGYLNDENEIVKIN